MDYTENRMAGDYEIIQSVYVGDREVVLGENLADTSGGKYLCSLCQHSDLGAYHQEVFTSDSYLEVMKVFGERIVKQAEKVRLELSAAEEQGVSVAPLSAADCIRLSPSDDLERKIVVIRADVLRREYQTATHQLKYCIGGFGASPNSRGSALFCVDLFSAEESRFERWDVLGTMTPEMLPEWAKHGLSNIQQKMQKQKDRGAR